MLHHRITNETFLTHCTNTMWHFVSSRSCGWFEESQVSYIWQSKINDRSINASDAGDGIFWLWGLIPLLLMHWLLHSKNVFEYVVCTMATILLWPQCVNCELYIACLERYIVHGTACPILVWTIYIIVYAYLLYTCSMIPGIEQVSGNSFPCRGQICSSAVLISCS